MKNLFKKFIGNKKVCGVIMVILCMVLLPYHIFLGTISGITILYGTIHDWFCALMGIKGKRFVNVLNYTNQGFAEAFDELDEVDNMFELDI